MASDGQGRRPGYRTAPAEPALRSRQARSPAPAKEAAPAKPAPAKRAAPARRAAPPPGRTGAPGSGRPSRPSDQTRRSAGPGSSTETPPARQRVPLWKEAEEALQRRLSARVKERVPLWREAEERERRRLASRVRERLERPRLTSWRERYVVVPDIEGPRVRLGLVWFAVLVGSFWLGVAGTTTVFALVAAFAGYQVADAWHYRGIEPDGWIAAIGAGLIGAAGAVGTRWIGVAILLLVVAAVVGASLASRRDSSVSANAGHTVLAGFFAGVVAASVATTFRFEIGAVVVLVLLVCAYDAGDFLVGAGASSPVEGPLAGALAVLAVTFAVAVLRVPPFRGLPAWGFGVAAAVCCPLGQLLGSALLPRAATPAPAFRRLDSWLLIAPVWAVSIGIYIQHHH